MIKVLIIHNYETPYRHKLFTELSQYVDLSVVYLQNKEVDNRLWSVEDAQSYKNYHIKSYQVGKLALNKISELHRMIDNRKYDVIFLSDNLPNIMSNFYVSLISKGVKKILWSEDIYSNPCYPKIKAGLLKISQWFLCNRVDGIVAFTKEAFAKWKNQLPFKNIFYCPQSSLFSNELLFNDLPKTKGELRLIFVGSFTGRKNEEILCKTVYKLSQYYNILLTLIGEGPIKNKLQRKYGSAKIKFLGFIDHSKILEYFKKNHFLILPSKYDTWGMVVNESMSVGTPAIVSKCVGAKELVRDSGFIINTEKELEKVLVKALYMDNSEYKLLRRKAFEYSKEYTIETSAINLFNSVKKIMNK